MKKVLVIGSGGAGKSTFARRLGAILKLEVIHLDALYWSAGWVEMPKDEWRKTVEDLIKKDSWIMDGNYGGTLDARLAACDTVIFLDIARLICLRRVIKRRVLYRNASRPDMAEGCPEKVNREFIKWIWDYPRKRRPAILEKLQSVARSKQVIVLKSPTEIENFLTNQQLL
jgi:adenylate kinase family enzyme